MSLGTTARLQPLPEIMTTEIIWCHNCGHEIRAYDHTCGNCRARVARFGRRAIRFTCKECGKQTDACHSDHDTCSYCGSRYGNCQTGWVR